MNTILNLRSYPIFTPNQVLTDADLNGVVNYLEGLNQLTRTYFVGMGIAYGLDLQRSNPTEIQITPGCGITSQGFVIQMTTPDTFTHYQESQIAQSLFIPGASPQASYKLKELVPKLIAQTSSTTYHPLTEAGLQNQVVVALYDWQDLPRVENCQLNYDEQSGKERSFRLRFFLLPNQQLDTDPSALSAEQLLRVGYQMEQLLEPWKTFDRQFGTAAVFEARNQFLAVRDLDLQVQRFGYEQQSVDLTKIDDYESWRSNYFQICSTAIATIDKAFSELFRLFSPFFTTFQPNSKQDFATLSQSLNQWLQRFHPSRPLNVAANTTEPPYALQYFYDYLCQLVAAYHELVDVVFDLMDDCTPDMARFPRFLMLGLVSPINQLHRGYEVPSAYRSTFIQPRIYNNNQTRIQQVRHLYDRLLNLCDFSAGKESFYLLPFYKTPVKLTPSKDRSAALSEQAIPYYLNYPKIYQTWNYDAYRKGRSDRHPAYFYPKQPGETTPHVFDDLTYRLDAYNFYRIEGHIGQSNAKALKDIQDYQKRYNLPFDIITLKLGKAENFQDLNLSAQFEHLSATFAQLQDRFQARWTANQPDWSNYVLITTLKRVFFDQPSLEAVNSDLLFSRFLDSAKASENYEFVPRKDATNQPTEKYSLYLKNRAGTRIARYQLRDSANVFDLLNFSGMTETTIAQEQKRIISGLVNALTPDKITYGIDRQSPSLLRFYLKFLSSDTLTVPLDRSGTPSSEALNVELVSLNTFAIQETPVLTIEDSDCPDVTTLLGLLRDIPESMNREFQFKLGDAIAAQEIGSIELMRLIEAYQHRLEQLISLQLFDRFAQQHPGMEPLGGVPKGGTFILVYVDGQDVAALLADEQAQAIYDFRIDRSTKLEAAAWLPSASSDPLPTSWETLLQEIKAREDIVVADFCLPYRSSSNAPVVDYVLARPRPVVLLQKNVFCEGDSTAYPFILEPEGGTVKGEGVSFDGHQHIFQPNHIRQASQDVLANGNEITITISYAVDDTFDTLSVTIHPKPKPSLTIQPGQTFCNNAAPIEIEFAPGVPAHYELVRTTINSTETTRLDPTQYATNGEPETVAIAVYVLDSHTQCENTLMFEITINPCPDADFQIGQPEKTSFFPGDSDVTLSSRQAGGEFQALAGGQDISQQVLEATVFSPSKVRLGKGEIEKTIDLKYSITQNGCSSHSTKQVTVLAPPAIDILYLLMDGEIPIRIELQGDRTFPQAFFSTNCRFEPQVQGKVNSIVFTYTSPDGVRDVMAPVNTAPYRMPHEWEPSIGTHEITAQPFSETNGTGVSGETQVFRIMIGDDSSDNSPPVVKPSPDAEPSPQPDSSVKPLAMSALLPDLAQSSDSSFNSLKSISRPIQPSLLPQFNSGPEESHLSAIVPSHPDPIPPDLSTSQPSTQRARTKFVPALVLGAIATFFALMWAYSGTKPPNTSQPANSSTVPQQPVP